MTPKPAGQGLENGDYGGGDEYGHWAWSSTKNDWTWVDLGPKNLTDAQKQQAANDPGGQWVLANDRTGEWTWNPSTNTHVAVNKNSIGAIPEIFSKSRGDNPFGDALKGTLSPAAHYSPFTLTEGNRMYGMPSYNRGYSFGSEQLVPSLEQRRMGMLSQLVGGRR